MELSYEDSFSFYYISAVTCGLQNGMVSLYSGNVIRTTHVTGTMTDIGVLLGRLLKDTFDGKVKRKGEAFNEIWKLFILLPLIFGFFFGTMIGTKVYERFKRYK